MKNSFNGIAQIHPMVIFWLGLLTGALIVGLVFFYRVLNPADYESAILKKFNLSKPATTQVAPKAKNLNAFPTPQGGYNAFPTPQGG